jgi:hypothetical protein
VINQAEAAIITMLVGTTTGTVFLAARWWKARRKMKAEELRALARTLDIEARKNIQRGMMNPAAPFARGPQPRQAMPALRLAPGLALPPPAPSAGICPADHLECRAGQPAPVDTCTCDDGPVLPCPIHQHGTFFWPGLAEEEIKKEREGNGND